MSRFCLNPPTLKIFTPCLQIPQPPQILSNPLHPHNTRKLNTLACQTNPNHDQSSITEKSIVELDNSEGTSFPKGPPILPSKDLKKKIAMVSFLGALGLLLSARLHLFGVPMKDHCAHALPSQEVFQARPNGKPDVVEFYADWYEVCGELTPDVYKVEYKDK